LSPFATYGDEQLKIWRLIIGFLIDNHSILLLNFDKSGDNYNKAFVTTIAATLVT
jgi:hypothetical protein